MKPTLNAIKNAMASKGYRLFTTGSYNLNIIGVRTQDMRSNAFNDWLCVYYMVAGREYFYAFPATTDPGVFWRKRPINSKGTAILVPGQYRGMWRQGLHRKKYKALVQRKPVRVWRDGNCDEVMDCSNADQGLFGINLHRANPLRTSLRVDRWSAGCQVLASPRDFKLLMSLVRHSAALWGDSFTYTLLEEADLG